MSDPLPQGPLDSVAGETPIPASPTPGNTGRIAFCQDCGKPLTAETLRAVGTGVFCEPCLVARVTSQSATQTGYAAVPPTGFPVDPITGPAHPVLAGFLGLIPGVGAMYNGQYAKGFAHLIIFVLLDSIAKNVSGVFHIFVFAWVCYQIFDAYHTARARNEGLPLPDFFGLNDIGEKVGFGKTWGPAAQGAKPASTATPPPPVSAWQAPPSTGPVPSGPDWVGYVPPTNFASAAAPRAQAYATATPDRAYHDTGVTPPPPAETFPGSSIPYTAPPVQPHIPAWAVPTQPLQPETFVARKRFPTGAFWLIGLGLLILLANLVPDWRLAERWWLPVLFAGLSILIFARRLRSGAQLLTSLRVPIVLMALAVLFALQAADIFINFGIFFAVLFIAIGLLLVLERTLGAAPAYIPADTTSNSFVPAAGYPGTAYSSTSASDPGTSDLAQRDVSSREDISKGGLS